MQFTTKSGDQWENPLVMMFTLTPGMAGFVKVVQARAANAGDAEKCVVG